MPKAKAPILVPVKVMAALTLALLACGSENSPATPPAPPTAPGAVAKASPPAEQAGIVTLERKDGTLEKVPVTSADLRAAMWCPSGYSGRKSYCLKAKTAEDVEKAAAAWDPIIARNRGMPIAAPAPAARSVVTIAAPMVIRDRVTGCAEFTSFASNLESIAAGVVDSGQVVLKGTCGEEFPGRTVLAKCAAQPIVGGSVHMTIRYYSVKSASDKAHMDCVREGGTWSQLSEESREYKRARFEELARKAGL